MSPLVLAFDSFHIRSTSSSTDVGLKVEALESFRSSEAKFESLRLGLVQTST